MMRNTLILLTSALSTLWLAPTVAEACSCARPTLQRELILTPVLGRALPTNAHFRLLLTGGYPAALRQALSQELRLRDPRGTLIPLKATLVGTRLDLKPLKPLEPRQRYQLEQVYAFDAKGDRLTDQARWLLARGVRGHRPRAQGSLRRAWYPLAAVTTGAGKSKRRPRAPKLLEASRRFAYGGGDCGPGSSLSLRYTLPDANDNDVVELEVEGRGVVATFKAQRAHDGRGYRGYIGDLMCTPDKVTLGSGVLKVRLRLRSITGRASAPAPWLAVRSGGWRSGWSGAAPQGRLAVTTPAIQKAVQRWLAAALVVPTANSIAAGPPACLGGFEEVQHYALAEKGAPGSYEALGSVGWQGGRGWALAQAQHQRPSDRVVQLFFGGKPAKARWLANDGLLGVGRIAGKGLLLAATLYTQKPQRTQIIVTAHDAAGKLRWRQALGSGRYNNRPQLTLQGDRVLVVWRWSPKILENHVRWAILEGSSGRVLVQPAVAALPRIGADSLPGVTATASAFYISFAGPRRDHTVSLLSISRDGKETKLHALPLPKAGPILDIVAAGGDQLAIATANQRQIDWLLVDGKTGRRLAGPVRVSRGVGADNRKPRISFDGKIFAVGWEAYPAGGVHVVAIDGQGRVSPPTRLGGATKTATIALAPASRDRFVASYAERWGKVRAGILRCRKSAPPGPPANIGLAPGAMSKP